MPKWLQQRFSLHGQQLILPNGTYLQYRHATVPVSRAANARFGKIEEHIARGRFSTDEVYLWAYKIHLGLLWRSAHLPRRRAAPRDGAILKLDDFRQDVWLFRQLFRNWSEGGSTDPAPFGSVFVLDPLYPHTTFDLIHSGGLGVVGVNIGPCFIASFIRDQCDGLNSSAQAQYSEHAARVLAMSSTASRAHLAYMAQRTWLLETAYALYRSRRGMTLRREPKLIRARPPGAWPPPRRPAEEHEFTALARSFGLKLEVYGGEANNKYSRLPSSENPFRSGAISA